MSFHSVNRAARAERALAGIRGLVAVLLFVHGAARGWHGGVEPFGAWLDSLGFPGGLGIAWFVTVYELAAAPLLAVGPKRWVTPIALVFATIYGFGLWLVHWPAGWFVVGLGRNGMEYSVCLIGVLLAVAWCGWPESVLRRRR